VIQFGTCIPAAKFADGKKIPVNFMFRFFLFSLLKKKVHVLSISPIIDFATDF
jgi:hypothetical protein